MSDLLHLFQIAFANAVDQIESKPETLIQDLGLLLLYAGTMLGFMLKWRKEIQLQYRNNYFSLELEASRIFSQAIQHPDIPAYLRGDLDEDKRGQDPQLQEQAFWFLSQELNIFEIAISLRDEKTITSELFATWVPWFYEVGTYLHFRDFWVERPYELMYNYKQQLQDIMTAAIELRRSPNFNEEDPKNMERFCAKVAAIFGDRAILAQYRRTMRRNTQLEQRIQRLHTELQSKAAA
jgi:hypothetical protein